MHRPLLLSLLLLATLPSHAGALKRDKDCKYTEYPTGGHGIVGKVFEEEEMHIWLFAKGVAVKK